MLNQAYYSSKLTMVYLTIAERRMILACLKNLMEQKMVDHFFCNDFLPLFLELSLANSANMTELPSS